MKIKHTGLVFYIGLLISIHVNASANKDNNPRLEAKIMALAEKELKETGVPSLQVSVAHAGNIIYEGAFGYADIENEVLATPLSKYRTASVAKWFTATAAMRLAEKEKLDLDAPIQAYCPEFPKKSSTITARQLITHTAGIRHYIDFDAAIAEAVNNQERSELERKQRIEALSNYTRYTDVVPPLDIFKSDALEFNPGEGWKYTSFGYRLLACVIQGAAEKPFAVLMDEDLFRPIKMLSTVPDDAWKIIPKRTTGYRLERGVLRKADLRDVSENLPAGGYLSTASDLVRFASAFNRQLVSSNNKKLMLNPVNAVLDENSKPSWRDAMPQQDKYGYGVMLFSKYKKGMVGHTGRQAGGSSIVVLLPDEDIAIAVMTNAKGWNGFLGFISRLLDASEAYVQSSRATVSSGKL